MQEKLKTIIDINQINFEDIEKYNITIADVIKEAMDEKGWKAADLARAAHVTPSAISRILNGSKQVGAWNIYKILLMLNLLNKKDELNPGFLFNQHNIVTIPCIEDPENAINSDLDDPDSFGMIGNIYFTFNYLSQISKDPYKIFGFDYYSDNMEPIISENSLLLIDPKQKKIIPGKKYLIKLGNTATISYIDIKPNAKSIRFENTKYPPINIEENLDESNFFKIIGRVIWTSTEI